VALDPSPLYILVESRDLDWSFTVEEALDAVVGADGKGNHRSGD
jgi:hypothetical protein